MTPLVVKRPDGAHNWYSSALLWPYSLSSRGINTARRAWSKEAKWTHVADGWYIGGWPAGDAHLPEPGCAVLDCVLELPRKHSSPHYLTLPVWDTCGFSLEQVERGAAWAAQQRREGRPVYVHCAYGHGRSCTMLSACLVEAGLFPNFVAAFRHISALRPRVYINARQRPALLEWSRRRGDVLPADTHTTPAEQPPEAPPQAVHA